MVKGKTQTYLDNHPAAKRRQMQRQARINARPEQKAYRRRLAAARRARGIMGKGGGDLSHTASGQLRIRPKSINRAANGHGNNSRYA
tara:strand:+ start:80 stop:340 length:261 start_codon:yes stop_codon:yes gene_type:complete